MSDDAQSFHLPFSELMGLETRLCFTLSYWCLWHSAVEYSDDCWPDGDILPCHQGNADVSFLPMMQRRRLSPLAKAACAVAWRCRLENGDMPSVFFSGHGESQYYFEMLEDIAVGESVSPSRFSLCVHNAIAGLNSIHCENVLPYVSLAGGTEGMFAAFLEAGGMLLDAPKVLAVWYEQPLPLSYRPYLPCSETTWALAMVLTRAGESGPQLRLTRKSTNNQTITPSGELDMLKAILTGRRSGQCQLDRATWHWRLDDV